MADDGREWLDVRIDSAAREGLTGTTPGSMHRPLHDAEQITLAPDGRPMEDQPAWRTDFPIDWPQDHYVERREFMKFMVLTSLAFAVGQAWIALQRWWRGHPPGRDARLGSIDDVAIGSVQLFAYPTPRDPCVLVRLDDRTLVAYSQKCTHLSCAVLPRVEEGVLRCPCHEGFFDLASGRPIAGPPKRPLSLIRLELRGREVFATGVQERTV